MHGKPWRLCFKSFALDLPTGELTNLNNSWSTPDGGVIGIRYLFSADRSWFAATDYQAFELRSVVGRWDQREEMASLAAGLDTLYTVPQFWSGHSLAFLAYPPGEGKDWPEGYRLDLYLLNAETGEQRLLARGATNAFLDPTGSRVAVFMAGSPRVGADGVASAEGDALHLALFSWPELQLLGSCPVACKGRMGDYDSDCLMPTWSRDGTHLVFAPAAGSLASMDREGKMEPILTGRRAQRATWGADGILALLVDGRIWLVRSQTTVSLVRPSPGWSGAGCGAR